MKMGKIIDEVRSLWSTYGFQLALYNAGDKHYTEKEAHYIKGKADAFKEVLDLIEGHDI